MKKTKQEVAEEIKKLLKDNGMMLSRKKKFYAPCEDCYDEFIYVADTFTADAEHGTIVTTI